MKILWISHLLPFPPKGGVMQRSYNLLHELCKYNDIDFLTFYQTAHHALPENLLRTGIDELNKFCNVIGVYPVPGDQYKWKKILNVVAGLLTKDPYMIWWLRDKRFSNALIDAVTKKEYDVYYFDTLGLAQYLHSLPENKGLTVLNHHNIESQLIHRRAKNETNIFRSFYFAMEARKRRKYERNICHQFKHNVVVSHIDKKRLLSITGKISCSEVPNGVDINYFKTTGVKQKENRIIFIGGLTFYPNIAAVRFILKNIWPCLKTQSPSLKFYIVGRQPPKDVRRIAELDQSVVVTGYVDDIRPLMEKSAVYVCPITDGGGTKLKILDALAMEKALVAHPIACEGIDVTDGKDVFLANTPQQFIKKIIQLLDDPIRRTELGNKARYLIESKYSFNSIGKDFSDRLISLSVDMQVANKRKQVDSC
ncbi:MAG: glycosyltransferase [Bacteroidetes bacterium]|nr:glycosyltransferase [Bacteroidota bacterium]